MEVLLTFLPLLGCALMMAVCMGLMGGFRRRRGSAAPEEVPPTAEEVAALRDEVARLRAERGEEARSGDG